ncbi:MAG: DUF975 family protein [Clostridia bacterium]|nr:DUF975 family protein [Clostridia bacterium]
MNQQFDQEQFYQAPFTPVKDSAYYRAKARKSLTGIWGISFLVSFLAMLLGGTDSSFNFNFELPADQTSTWEETFASGSATEIISSFPWITLLLIAAIVGALSVLAISIFVSSPIRLGFARFHLAVVDQDKEKINVSTLFSYFKISYWKSVGLYMLRSLISFACSLPTAIAGIIAVFSVISSLFSAMYTGNIFAVIASLLLVLPILLVGAAVSVVLYFLIDYNYYFSEMIMAEYPEIGVVDALRSSRNLMRGKKWKLFCLDISFIGWILLAAFFTCGIGMIFLTPYIQTARAHFYHDIANRDAAKETEFPSLDPNDYTKEQE